MDIQEACKILGVTQDTDTDTLKRAYRKLVKMYHPDQYHNDPVLKEKTVEKLKRVNLAYTEVKSVIAKRGSGLPKQSQSAPGRQPPASQSYEKTKVKQQKKQTTSDQKNHNRIIDHPFFLKILSFFYDRPSTESIKPEKQAEPGPGKKPNQFKDVLKSAIESRQTHVKKKSQPSKAAGQKKPVKTRPIRRSVRKNTDPKGPISAIRPVKPIQRVGK